MNYRHAYHAGNFADVVKHAVLARIIDYLKRKPKAFRVIDTHAGAGLYDLSGAEAQRTGEWRDGIARVLDARLEPAAETLLAPYLDTVRGLRRELPNVYPGSPLLVRHLLRPQDRLLAIEKHPADAASLRQRLAGDHQARVLELDGWLALGAHVPPKERRGLVVVDPPFEAEGEFERLVAGLARAHRRWPHGVYALWYPLKHRGEVASFRELLRSSGIPAILDLSMNVREAGPEARLDGCGLVVANPPYTLAAEARTILAALTPVLAAGRGAQWSVDWLANEAVSP